MSAQVDTGMLEEGEIEDEEDEANNLPEVLSERGRRDRQNESGPSHVSTNLPNSFSERPRRHSYGQTTSRLPPWENVPVQRPHDSVLLPLTRGGYWAPPPLLPTPLTSSPVSQSPGSRVFKYLRNRTKSLEANAKEIENRRPVTENRSTKRKVKSFPKSYEVRKPPEDDSDFENLLRKHKEIQAQLAKLSKEEEKSETDSSVIEIPTPVSQQAEVIDLVEVSEDAQQGNDTTKDISTVSTQPENISAISVVSTEQEQAPANGNTEEAGKSLDDDDLDALELRKLALESVVTANAKKAKAAVKSEAPAPHVSGEPASHMSSVSTGSSKRRSSKSGGSRTSSPVKRSGSSNRASKGHSLTHRDRKLFSPVESVDRYGRQRKLRRHLSSHRELERRRRESEDKRRREERARQEEKRKRFEARQRQEAEKQRQREAIQEILKLDDPAVQVERFLKLVKGEGNSHQKQKTPARAGSGRKRDVKTPLKMEDNYEEVEMEIDSDSPVLPSIEGFPLDGDMGFLNTMPPHFQNSVPPGMDPNSLASFGSVQVLSEWPVKPFHSWAPPLPPEEPPPPPPADRPPPTPPAPPLPEDPCPQGDTPKSVEQEEDADEESLLREQLLKSMAVKRKQATPESIPSRGQSPSGSPVPSSTGRGSDKRVAVRERHKPKPSRARAFQLPIHDPVVIKLGEDSDDSDGDGLVRPQPLFPAPPNMLGGIDSFLKQVRKSVDKQKQTSHTDRPPARSSPVPRPAPEVSEEQKLEQASVRQMEEKLVILRKDTLKEQSVLKSLIEQSSKYQNNKRLAEERLQKLQEHIAGLQKIALACGQEAEKVKAQVREVRKNVKERVSRYRQLEERTLTKGVGAFGQDYKLPVQLNKKAVKRKTNDSENRSAVKKQMPVKKLKEVGNLGSPASPMSKRSVQEIAEEKTRLQELEQEYAKKIKQLKLAQARQTVSRGKTVPNKESPRGRENRVPSVDKIYLGNGENVEVSDVSDDNENPVKRRRSLLDSNISTRPNIASHDKEDSNKEDKQPSAKRKGVIFSLPDGQRRQNLQQLEGEKLQKLLKSFTVAKNKNLWKSCLRNVPVAPVEQFSGHDLEKKFTSERKSNSAEVMAEPCPIHYTSPLLHFKSYRLSRYYRTKERLQLSSRTYSNRVDPHRQMCRFELQGTCNDEKCPWQHEADYVLSQSELLADIISYCPKLAGVKASTDAAEYKTLIDKYVDKFISQHGEHMTTDQLCVLIVSEVQKAAGMAHPWSVRKAKRTWKPCQVGRVTDSKAELLGDPVKPGDLEELDVSRDLSPLDMDNVISDQDVRYFLDGPGVQDVESAVLQEPTNVQLWISLAYKKLHGPQAESGGTGPLDLCLNVLARGLEENKASSELWYHYLKIYNHHPHSEDIHELCETAIACAPTYQLYMQYLRVAVSFPEKESICKRLLEYLMTVDLSSVDLRSFHLLEAVIYLVDVYIQSGRYKTGLLYLQSLLPLEERPVNHLVSLLVPLDTCILWLTYISLTHFHQLPASIINPRNQTPGNVVSRDTFQLPWESHPDLASSATPILESLWKAVSNCCPQAGPRSGSEAGSRSPAEEEVRLALYMNILTVQQLFVSVDSARSTCGQWIRDHPGLHQLYTIATAIEFNSGNHIKAMQMIERGLDEHRHCAKLYYNAANLYLTQKDSDHALGLLEQCVIGFYDVDISDSKTCDPNLLYCKTLQQPVPLTYKAPPFAAGVTDQLVQDQIGTLWLNYCLLLELQGDMNQAVESFETALGLFQSRDHLSQLWKGYLQFYQRQLSTLPPEGRQRGVSSLTALLHRCLASFPVKRELPYRSDSHWLDYTEHNEMVEVYLRSFPRAAQLAVFRRLVQLMPSNINLVIRSIEHALSEEDYVEAQSLCQSVLCEQVANCRLWKLAIGLSLKMKKYREVHKLYRRALQKLPLMFTLWKDFLLFEVTQGSEGGAKWIIEQCQKLGVNIKGFVATVSKLPT